MKTTAGAAGPDAIAFAVLLLSLPAAVAGQGGGPAGDREVLEALYRATSGPDWTDGTGWLTDAPLSAWFGVETDADGRVVSLLLAGNELKGRVPAELGRLSELRTLDLGWRWESATGGLFVNEMTGSIPSSLGGLSNLGSLDLGGNELTGRIPDALGDLANLERLDLGYTGLTGSIPSSLGGLSKLQRLDFSYSWGLSGPLPDGLGLSSLDLEQAQIFATQTCAPTAWGDWLATIYFTGRLCETDPEVTIDVAVFYTPAAREEAGGTAAIEAVIDEMIATTNQAYQASGVHHRVALVERSEVQYVEAGDSDIVRLANLSDGYMDEVHTIRDRTGADLVHLIFKLQDHSFRGIADSDGEGFGLTCQQCGGAVFAHQLGHNMGLERGRVDGSGDGDRPRRPERYAVVQGDGEGVGAVHGSPHPARRYAGQGRSLHRVADADRRLAARGGAGTSPLDGSGPDGGGDAGQAGASAGAARGAGRGVRGVGPFRAALD